MNSSILSMTDDTIVLSVNRNDITTIFTEDEIKYLLDNKSNVTIPEHSEIIEQAKIESQADSIWNRAIKDITSKIVKYRDHKFTHLVSF